jgi:hypothetical protein
VDSTHMPRPKPGATELQTIRLIFVSLDHPHSAHLIYGTILGVEASPGGLEAFLSPSPLMPGWIAGEGIQLPCRTNLWPPWGDSAADEEPKPPAGIDIIAVGIGLGVSTGTVDGMCPPPAPSQGHVSQHLGAAHRQYYCSTGAVCHANRANEQMNRQKLLGTTEATKAPYHSLHFDHASGPALLSRSK